MKTLKTRYNPFKHTVELYEVSTELDGMGLVKVLHEFDTTRAVRDYRKSKKKHDKLFEEVY